MYYIIIIYDTYIFTGWGSKDVTLHDANMIEYP